MNFTVLSLVLAAAQPLLQAILSCNINEISVGNLKKAKFKLVHSLKGRRRYSSVLLKDVTFAFTLKEKLHLLSGALLGAILSIHIRFLFQDMAKAVQIVP